MDYLNNVPDENAFYLCNGAKILNLEELLLAIRNSDDAVFYNHVTPDKNDFTNWIKAIIHYDEIVNKLSPIKDKREFLAILDQDIELLRNPKLRETAKFFEEQAGEEKPESNATPTKLTKDENILINPTQNQVKTEKIAQVAEMLKDNAVPITKSDNLAPSNIQASVQASGSQPKPSPAPGITANPLPSADEVSPAVSESLEISEFEEVFSVLIQEINSEIFSDI